MNERTDECLAVLEGVLFLGGARQLGKHFQGGKVLSLHTCQGGESERESRAHQRRKKGRSPRAARGPGLFLQPSFFHHEATGPLAHSRLP